MKLDRVSAAKQGVWIQFDDARRLAAIAFPDLGFVPVPGDAIAIEGKIVGKVTSADRGYFVGGGLVLGYAPPDIAAGAKVTVIDGAGTKAEGELQLKAPYDAEMIRLKAEPRRSIGRPRSKPKGVRTPSARVILPADISWSSAYLLADR